jgi:hypothetical protein
MYVYRDQDGNLSVVDANGKTLAGQPLIGTHDGVNYSAYYPGDSTVTPLDHYRRPQARKAGRRLPNIRRAPLPAAVKP